MARRRATQNGPDRLGEALANLHNQQVAFVKNRKQTNRLHAQLDRQAAERFARIEAQMAEIIRILNEHSRILSELGRMLEHMDETICEKMGFKAPQ
jgi:hypothetical protein